MTETERQPRWTAYVPLAEILRAPRNPKTHATQVIAESVSRFGVVELPALDERTGRLVAGHGRLDDWVARYTAGDEPPDGVRKADDGGWLVPVNRGWSSRSDAEAEAYLIVSNRSVELGGWNVDDLEKVLAEIAREDFTLAQVTGYSAAQLDALLDAYPDDRAIDGSAVVDTFLRTQFSHVDVEHDQVPASAARYAETPEQEAGRSEAINNYQPRAASGLVEMILVYPRDERDEVGRLIAEARTLLGSELKASEIVLRALRVMATVLDNRHNVEPVTFGSIAHAAGLQGAEGIW